MPLYLLHEDVLDVCLWVSANLRPVLNHAAAAVISDLPLVAGMHGSVDVSHNIIVSHHMHSWEDRHEAHKDAREPYGLQVIINHFGICSFPQQWCGCCTVFCLGMSH